MSVDVNEVQALTFDDFGDDVDSFGGPNMLRSNDEENMPPKRLVLNRPLGGGGASRPMTAGSTFSELEELSLDGLSAPKPAPRIGRSSRELGSLGGPQSPGLAAVVPRGLQSPRGLQNSSPPWSPASMNIPTLDEFPEGPPQTPSQTLSVAVPDTSSSPTSSEKAKAGCAVM